MKGTNEDDFMRLTSAEPTGFELQIQALKNSARFNIITHPAVMVSFSSPENIKALRMRLKENDEDFEDFEVEELALYRKVEERLLKGGLEYDTVYEPTCISNEQV